MKKIGQLRLISIGPEMPREMIRKEIAAGNIGGTFNSITRAEKPSDAGRGHAQPIEDPDVLRL